MSSEMSVKKIDNTFGDNKRQMSFSSFDRKAWL